MNFNILIENNLEISSVLDIGAHAGTFTFECKKYYPNAYYYMIDGNPITEDYIKHSGVDYKITYLSDIVKKTVVYKTKYNAFNTGDSLFRENTNYYNDENLITQDITTSTLDELFKNEKVFDFIKIDSQGSEMDIIKGGLEMCKQSKIFLLEASVYPYNLNAPMFDELKEFMGSIGFGYNKIVSDIYHPNDGNLLIQHDVLFSKIELL
jgi:FkbM family methyltransferase